MPTAQDLPTVTHPGVWDLIELANGEDFHRVEAMVKQVRGCTSPIRLAGSTTTLDANTGAVLHSYSTTEEPTGRILIACNNRRATRCPSCSRLYAGDTYQLIKSGLVGGKNTPATVGDHPRVFVTLTAPSFGPVHGTRLPHGPGCRCGTTHPDDDPRIGTPLNPATYDYTGAVLFNAHAGELWGRFTTYLRRNVARLLRRTQKETAALVRVSFAKVAEYQDRGLIHYHAIIRFDGPEGSTEPPPSWATARLLTKAARLAARHVTLDVSFDKKELTLSWGRQLDIRQITPDDGTDSLISEAVAGYIAKYATKGAMDTGILDRPLRCRECHGSGNHLANSGSSQPCITCAGSGRDPSLTNAPVSSHIHQMIRTCWDLGTLPELAHLNLHKWAHMLGFRGHFSTKSRRYSTTLGALREERRTWQRNQHNRPETQEETTLVLSDWIFLGIGYRPGEELLAAQVRHDRSVALALRHELRGQI
ncbi:MAG TPA: replication initiator [Anaerolineae bacterium]|nr:replication initiator [Anaerolineae bacterium]